MKYLLALIVYALLLLPESEVKGCAVHNSTSLIVVNVQADSVIISEEARKIEIEVKKIINELSNKEQSDDKYLYQYAEDCIDALLFVQSSMLLHTKDFVLIDDEANTYKYSSPLLELIYTEDKKNVHGISEVYIHLRISNLFYTIVFNKNNTTKIT